MRLLFTTTLLIFTLSLFSNPIISEPKGKDNSTIKYGNSISLKHRKKKRTKYLLFAATTEANQTFLSTTTKNLTSELSNTFEFFSQVDRIYYATSITFSNLTVTKDILIDELANTTLEKNSQLDYSIWLFKMGYSVLFKEKLRITPYAHLGYGDLVSYHYSTNGEEKTKTLFSKFTTGIGVRGQYLIMELDKQYPAGILWLPTTIGITFDAGYNYQFADAPIPFGGNMGYVSIGVFLGRTVKNKYRW